HVASGVARGADEREAGQSRVGLGDRRDQDVRLGRVLLGGGDDVHHGRGSGQQRDREDQPDPLADRVDVTLKTLLLNPRPEPFGRPLAPVSRCHWTPMVGGGGDDHGVILGADPVRVCSASRHGPSLHRQRAGWDLPQEASLAHIVPRTEPMNADSQTGDGEQVDASVLVPVLNEERHIRDSVAAMQAQRFGGTVEFLFMDGRSEDRTKAILEELAAGDPRIRVFDNPGRSSTAGLNVGLRHARGDYIVRMDAHTFYPEDYIARGVERLRRGDVVWVAGPQVPHGVGRWSRRVALALGSWFGTGGSARWGAEA